MLVGAAVALLVMAGVTVFALTQRSRARSQATLARARELAATAVSQLPVDPQLSMALGVESADLKRTTQAEDVLRQALISSKERAILPSKAAVRSVSFSRDGSLLATASDDGTARIWRANGALLHTLRHRGPVVSAVFNPDGSQVLTASADGTARIWRAGDGGPIATLRHRGPVTSGSFSRDGKLVLTTSRDGTARLWRARTGAPVLVVEHGRPVLSGSLSDDGRLLVTISSDREGQSLRARLFALPSGRLVRQLPAKGVTTASFNPAGTLLVTGAEDHTAAVWRIDDGRRLFLFTDHQGGVTDAVFSPDGKLIVTTSSDGATRVWDARTGQRVVTILGHANAVNSSSFSKDGKFIVTASTDGTARVWEAATGRFEAVLRGHTDSVTEGTFRPDGRAIATASADGTARIWDPGTAPELRVLAVDRGPVWAASFSPDDRLVLTAGDDRTARILTSGGRVLQVLRHPTKVTSATFSPDGKLVFTAGEDRNLRVWRTAGGALVKSVRNVSSGPLALSPDGRPAGRSGRARRGRDPRHRRLPSVGEVEAWGATDRCVLQPRRTAARDRRRPMKPAPATERVDVARIWDARTGTLVQTFTGHRDAVTSVRFSPDGKLLLTDEPGPRRADLGRRDGQADCPPARTLRTRLRRVVQPRPALGRDRRPDDGRPLAGIERKAALLPARPQGTFDQRVVQPGRPPDPHVQPRRDGSHLQLRIVCGPGRTPHTRESPPRRSVAIAHTGRTRALHPGRNVGVR